MIGSEKRTLLGWVKYGAGQAAKGLGWLIATFPIPTAIVAGVLLVLFAIWFFWPSSQNQKNADNAANQAIEKTGEIEHTKTDTIKAESNANAQGEVVKRAEANVANKAPVVKAAKERVAQTRKAAQRASSEREKASQTPVKDSKLDEVIANCQRVYAECK